MKRTAKGIAIIIAGLLIAAEALAAQTIDTTATVVCGKSEQTTPCILILNRSVPSYELTIRKDDADLITFKVERVKGAWQVLGEKRKGRLIEVIVDTKDASYVIVDPRMPNISRDIVPEGCDGLIVKTVEVKK